MTEAAIIICMGPAIFRIARAERRDKWWVAPELTAWLSGNLPGDFPLSLARELAASHGLALRA